MEVKIYIQYKIINRCNISPRLLGDYGIECQMGGFGWALNGLGL